MKTKTTRKSLGGVATLIALLFVFTECSSTRKKIKVSDDVQALSSLINLHMKYAAARWEIFEFPEQSDWSLAIGPTDYINLIAELSPLDSEAFRSLPLGEEAHIKVGSARPWLRPEFKRILAAGESSSFILAKNSACRPLDATLRKSNRMVNGIICKSDEKAVVLLFLTEPT